MERGPEAVLQSPGQDSGSPKIRLTIIPSVLRKFPSIGANSSTGPPIAAEIRATLAVAAPLAAANLAQMAMQVTNAVMVGHLGAVPLAGAGLGNAHARWKSGHGGLPRPDATP